MGNGRELPKEEISIGIIRSYFKEKGRIPAKRELVNAMSSTIRLFGTWNNAIRAAGFEPNRSHDDRMYKRTRTVAADGHVCDSVSEP